MSISILLHTDDEAQDPVHYYLPGATITGSVILELQEDVKEYEYFTVTIHGKAQITINPPSRRSAYADMQILINQTFPLLPVEKKAKIPKGRSVYPFQFVLPQGIPCSFNSPQGQVFYEITTELKLTKDALGDITSRVSFFVRPCLDFNRTKASLTQEFGFYEEIYEYELANNHACSCSKRAQVLILTVCLPKRFFLVGECIRFKVIVDNRSTGAAVSFLHMELLKRITYKGAALGAVDRRWETEPTHEQESEDAVLMQMLGPVVPPKTILSWDVNDLVIPTFDEKQLPLLPSGLGGGCRCIDMAYALHLMAQFQEGCCSKYNSVDQFIPIMIGNIPLK